MCEPIVDLEHVGQHLRTGHELPVPGLPIVGRAVYKCVDFLGIQQAVDWRIGIGQDFFQLAAKHFFRMRGRMFSGRGSFSSRGFRWGEALLLRAGADLLQCRRGISSARVH